MSIFRVRKPRPFHHEMIYQGRTTGEINKPSRLHFTMDKGKEKQKRVIPLELIALVALIILLAYLFYQ